MEALDFRLLNEFQRDFPLIPRPFEELGRRLGIPENRVLARLSALRECGIVNRVGPVFRPNRVGTSTLAAMAIPENRVEEVAHRINARPGVNHNYLREHRFNLWFVVTAPNAERLRAVLAGIESESGLAVMSLPLLEDYHIDLGFDLSDAAQMRRRPWIKDRLRSAIRLAAPPLDLTREESALVEALQEGLPLAPRPYLEAGQRAGLAEEEVMACLARWIRDEVIRRLGVIVHHQELGYRANAMVVWDVPDSRVEVAGKAISATGLVSLCYRRPRRLPYWPYNLFCLIHGRDRDTALGHVQRLRNECRIGSYRFEILFSTRRFKQCGARYVERAETAHG